MRTRLALSALGPALLLLLTVAVYLPTARYGFTWDDDDNVTQNQTLKTAEGLKRIWTDPFANQQYYPLTHTSFWIETRLWGLAPGGFHLVNAALHGIAAILLFLALRQLRVPGAWVAAALFAIHPVQVESVAWITERKNVLSGALYFGAALAYLRFESLGSPERHGRRWAAYAVCCTMFVAALAAKTAVVTLPCALLVVLWWKLPKLTWRDVLPLAPLFLVAVPAGLLTAWLERVHVGATGEVFTAEPAEKLLIAGRAFWFYVQKLVWPADLMFIYPRWTIVPSSPAQWLFPLTALAALAALWLSRGRIGRGPFAGAAFFSITVAPALGFFNLYFMLYSYVQDHFQYLAAAGVLALAVAAGHRALGMAIPGNGLVPARVATAAVVLGAAALLTSRHLPAFRDAETMWRDTLARNPEAWIAHNNLGALLSGQGRRQEALDHYRESVRLRPGSAEGHASLGALLTQVGRTDEARDAYREAIRLRPGLRDVHSDLSVLLYQHGDYPGAWRELQAYQRAGGRPHPDFVQAILSKLGAGAPAP